MSELKPIVELKSLNEGQSAALAAILDFISPLHEIQTQEDRFFLLDGPAGSGKTFLMQHVLAATKLPIVFTAPTNKATRVLRESLTTEEYTPLCKTIYSLLGLKLQPDGEIKVLMEPEDPIDLFKYKVLVLDEGSMVNETLWGHVLKAASAFNLKVIIMADAKQLPPVGESRSAALDIPLKAHLTQVERYDGAILETVTRIREAQDSFLPRVSINDDNDGKKGVWRKQKLAFENMIREAALAGDFTDPYGARVIAWRNVTVIAYNSLIRGVIFPGAEKPFVRGDRVILTEPAKTPVEEGEAKMVATDEEGTVIEVRELPHPVYSDYLCYAIRAQLDAGGDFEFWVPTTRAATKLKAELNRISLYAKTDRKLWKDFWALKEAFHSLRHSYAITSHRSQGSTYQTAFVDWGDILLNQNRKEAFQSLYVASTRPRTKLIFGS